MSGCDRGSVHLDASELDHPGPLLGFVGDQFFKIGGREREYVATQVGKPRLDLGVGEPGIDLLVELVDDLGRRGLRRSNAINATLYGVAVVTARARSLPALTYSIADGREGNPTCACPASRSTSVRFRANRTLSRRRRNDRV
jgi:hypothetical protein